MKQPIIIIGSGFAAYQLIKTMRRMGSTDPIQVFSRDSGDEYNKPDLSHVFSKQQTAASLVKVSGIEFAAQFNVQLYAYTEVESIDTKAQQISANGQCYAYSKLIFATGAQPFIPNMSGSGINQVITLNSLAEYQRAQQKLSQAQRVLIIGGGLIGVEFAMDLATAGRQVTLVEPNRHILANLLPSQVAVALEEQLSQDNIQLALADWVVDIELLPNTCLLVTTQFGRQYTVDSVICAAGLKPNIQLAQAANISTNRGIVVDNQLQTSAKNVYALGDCAEINGQLQAFLQPIILSANTLAKVLFDQAAELKLAAMMIKIKTPNFPIQLAGNTSKTVARWQLEINHEGILANAYNSDNQAIGFIVTHQHTSKAFSLLKSIQ
ncbi:NADH:flavorubredoxin reductase NorW [Shewanella marina]|uniref:NADH:flavorubredoxin reductase NorW n=1 Tax=Shewanella marina TaxID=487319 RepID=UPI000565A6A9|nr:NADH:flavorubredoxin reductase NorW [Shewanella marina]